MCNIFFEKDSSFENWLNALVKLAAENLFRHRCSIYHRPALALSGTAKGDTNTICRK